MPNFSMIAFSSAIEVMRMANRLSGETLYQWPTYTMDGQQVNASNGLALQTDEPIMQAKNLDILFVCSGVRVANVWSDKLKQTLHRFKTLKSRSVAFAPAPICLPEPDC